MKLASIASLTVVLSVLLASHPEFVSSQESAKSKEDVWAPLRPLVGKWEGKGKVPKGEADQQVEWKFIFGGKYLQATSLSVAVGDRHQDVGYFSYDRARKKFIYREFLSEGYVNTYVARFSDDKKTITLTSESIENGPPTMKALVKIKIDGDKLSNTLSLGMGDKPMKVCVEGKLRRVKGKRQ